MNKKTLFLIFLIISSSIFYYQLTEEKTPLITSQVIRVIDGDTIETDNGLIVRLKGINTPEKNEDYYQNAKEFLEKLTLNKTIQIENHGIDKYQRTLGYIYTEKELVNSRVIKAGLATSYYYEEDSHFNEILEAENIARESGLNLWKKSSNFGCLELLELRYIEPNGRCNEGELLELKNLCDERLEITIKDDATHSYKEVIPPKEKFSKSFSCVWNDEGDSLYIRDKEGLLIFYRY